MSKHVTSIKTLEEAIELIHRERASRNSEVFKYRKQIAELQQRAQEHEQHKKSLLAHLAEADNRQDEQAAYIRELEDREVQQHPGGILSWFRRLFAL